MRFRSLLPLVVFALCFLFLFGGTAYAQPREFAQPVFVVYAGPSFAAPKFQQGSCPCVVCPCPPGVCASGGCPAFLPVSFAPPASKYKDCPECVEAERAYQARQVAKGGTGVVYAAGSSCAFGNCGVSYQTTGAFQAAPTRYASSCASGSCGTSRTSRTWGIARLFSRR